MIAEERGHDSVARLLRQPSATRTSATTINNSQSTSTSITTTSNNNNNNGIEGSAIGSIQILSQQPPPVPSISGAFVNTRLTGTSLVLSAFCY